MSLFLCLLYKHTCTHTLSTSTNNLQNQNIDFPNSKFSPFVLKAILESPFLTFVYYCVRFWIFLIFPTNKSNLRKTNINFMLLVMTCMCLYMLKLCKFSVNSSKGLWFLYKEMLPYVTDSWYLTLILISNINFLRELLLWNSETDKTNCVVNFIYLFVLDSTMILGWEEGECYVVFKLLCWFDASFFWKINWYIWATFFFTKCWSSKSFKILLNTSLMF